jgi:hypothetical protein
MTLSVSGYFSITGLITDVFRLSGENFSYIKEMDVHQVLTKDPQAYYQFIKQRLTKYARKK